MISTSQRPISDNTQHSQETDIHALGGIRTHSLSRRSSADLRLRPGTHYPYVTWAYVMLSVRLACERRFNIEFYDADSHFCHSAYVTWSHLSRPELNVRSRDVSRVTEVRICTIQFNVKSPLTSQLHALTSHVLTWREDSVSLALDREATGTGLYFI
jgi:hypothetical protein